jgi:hypothetical protein
MERSWQPSKWGWALEIVFWIVVAFLVEIVLGLASYGWSHSSHPLVGQILSVAQLTLALAVVLLLGLAWKRRRRSLGEH